MTFFRGKLGRSGKPEKTEKKMADNESISSEVCTLHIYILREQNLVEAEREDGVKEM